MGKLVLWNLCHFVFVPFVWFEQIKWKPKVDMHLCFCLCLCVCVLFALIAASLFVGRLSDLIGRWIVLLFGLILYFVAIILAIQCYLFAHQHQVCVCVCVFLLVRLGFGLLIRFSGCILCLWLSLVLPRVLILLSAILLLPTYSPIKLKLLLLVCLFDWIGLDLIGLSVS